MTTIFHKLLGRQRPEPDDREATAPGPFDVPAPSTEQKAPNKALNWTFGSAQSIGCLRDHNEDALYTFGSHLGYEDRQAFLGLFIVADGMGGHVNGELASGLAVQVMAQHVIGGVYNNFLWDQPSSDIDSLKRLMLDGVQQANQAVKKHVPGGGTTMTALLIYEEKLILTHVGDSRAYLVTPDGTTQALTRDHSLVRQLVELGQLTDEEAAVHPQRNILSMAIGQWEPLEPDCSYLPLPAAGSILICSDGLWGVVPEKKILQTIHAAGQPQAVCQELTDAAIQAGGPDNITAILVRVPD